MPIGRIDWYYSVHTFNIYLHRCHAWTKGHCLSNNISNLGIRQGVQIGSNAVINAIVTRKIEVYYQPEFAWLMFLFDDTEPADVNRGIEICFEWPK